MKKLTHTYLIFITFIITPLLVSKSKGNARTQIINMYCAEDVQSNQTVFTTNFIRAMQITSTEMQTSHFATAVVGNGPDKNYVLTQCYGDLSSQDCLLCYAEIRTYFPTCNPKKGGRIYLDGCFVRLTNYSFFEEYTSPNDTTICGNTTRTSILFQDSAMQAVDNVVTDALRSNDYFARKEIYVSGNNDSVYVLAQCWKTLSPSSCRACLENASRSIRTCLPWSEGRVLNTGCFMRYSNTNFLNPAATRSSSNRGRIIAIVASVISSAVVIVVALMIVLYVKKRRYIQHRRKGSYDAEKIAKILNDSSLHFKYSTVAKATGYWDESNKLGQGGFGTVYKGVLPDGREIAVKKIFYNFKFRAADFYNEVYIISSVEHKNLVRLLGCSCSGPESVLIYEYLPNKSLDFFIFDETKGREIGWEKRVEIIIGIAEGLVYLHENTKRRIIHRDIKAPNILLDFRLRPKIADFGLARHFQDDKSHISTGIAGTLGYIAPEYLAHGQITEKVDVYSFGILILEVVTGIESNKSKITEEDSDSLLSVAWKHFKQGTVEEIFDPNLKMHIYPNINFKKDVIKVVHVALLCTQEAPSLRPSMSAALKMLANDDDLLPTPSNPPFINETTMEYNNITQRSIDHCDNDDSSSVATISHSDFYQRP